MKPGQAITKRLLELRTPMGTVGENVQFLVDIVKIVVDLCRLAGTDCIYLALNLLLGILRIPLALWVGQMWPWMAHVMDQGLDFGGTLLTMVVLANVVQLISFVQNRLKDIFFPRFLERVQLEGVRACLRKDTAFWDLGDPAGQVTWIFQQAERVKSFATNLENLIMCVLTFYGAITHVWGRSPKFTIIALCCSTAIGVYLMWIARVLASIMGDMDGMLAKLKGGSIESLSNIRTVQAFANEVLEVLRWKSRKEEWWQCKHRQRIAEALRRFSELIIQNARALGINYGGFLLVTSGVMQAGDVLLIQALLAEMLVSSFDGLVGCLRGLSFDLMFAQLFFGILRAPVQIDRDVGKVPKERAKGSIALRNVQFTYPARPDELVLRGVSFQVPAGSFTALVGATGSGKTTIGRLLERFYDIQSGDILFDGMDLKGLQPRWLRRQIGYVEQEPKLWQGSIRENILYGNTSASPEEVEEAARAAHVLPFASQLPDGLDTWVTSGGQSLSGGQKQRVAIARAMIRNPVVILMDEATSALDTETERSVQEALERLMSGRTTLVIAHRLTTVQKADQIVVMGGGSILETGTFAELAEKPDGAFAALMQHQQHQPQERLGGESPDGRSGKGRVAALATEPPAAEAAAADTTVEVAAADATAAEAAAADAADAGAAAADTVPVGAAPDGAATEPAAEAARGAATAGAAAANAAGPASTPTAHTPTAQKDGSPRPRGQLPVEQQPLLEKVGGEEREAEASEEENREQTEAEQRELKEKYDKGVVAYMNALTDDKRNFEKDLLKTPTSDRFFPQLLWMYRLMGWQKWLLLTCLVTSITEARVKLMIGPAFQHASSLLEAPAEYPAAFRSYLLICGSTLLLTFVKERLKDVFEPRLAETLQFKCYYALLRQDVDYFEKNDPASVVPRLFDQADFSAMTTTIASENLIHSSASLIFGVYEGYRMAPAVIIGTVLMALPLVATSWTLAMASASRSGDVDKAQSDLIARVVESLSNVKTMAAFGGEDAELEKFQRQRGVWWRAELRRRPWNILSDLVGTLSSTNLVFLTLILLVRQGAQGSSSKMAALLYMIKCFFDDIAAFMGAVTVVGNAKGSFAGIATALNEEARVEADVGDIPSVRATGELELRGVHFAYPSRPDKEVLSDVSFKIPVGSFTAIVGHTGSGKTTIGRLLLRFHDVDKGVVLMDGHPVSSLQPQWVRRQIGYVEQEPKLFDETLWNNIRYGRLDAHEAEIFGAAAAANILSFIQQLPNGFETNVGRLGQGLSGGQKQRVAIARALLVNPAMLLLDEATSALDTQTEHEVQEALERLMNGRTNVVIAHRLSTVARADQVVVLDAGRVVQLGTHQELQARGGHYARLLQTMAPEEGGGGEAPAIIADGGAAEAVATSDGGAAGGAADGAPEDAAAADGLRRRR